MKGSDIPNKSCPTCHQNMIKIVGLPSNNIYYECFCNKQETIIDKDSISVENIKYAVRYCFDTKVFKLFYYKISEPIIIEHFDESQAVDFIENLQEFLKNYEILK